MPDHTLIDTVRALIRESDWTGDSISLRPCPVSGNNRVYYIEGIAEPAIVKWYFQSSNDRRDRLRAEWSFLSFAREIGIHCVPRPIAKDSERKIALYERVDGSKIGTGEIGRAEISAAIDFLVALNSDPCRASAAGLPNASDSGFCIAEHFAIIDQRMVRLRQSTLGRRDDVSGLIADLGDYWDGMKSSIARSADQMALPLDQALPPHGRWLSPSDFGFHNALKRPDGGMCFIDFEYAGWDDPAKTVSDFFFQPGVPVDRVFYPEFAGRTFAILPHAEWHEKRAVLLRPVFGVKWCCIMLNAFVVERAQAGEFSNPDQGEEERRRTQLAKAKLALDALKAGENGWPT